MATVRDLIAGSMRLIGALDPNEAMEGAVALNALVILNDLIESLNLEHYINPTGVTRADVTLTAGRAFHTIGAGGDFNLPRPVVIERAYVITGSAEINVEVVSDEEWSDIPIKGITGLPQKLWYEPESPLGKVYLWPKPGVAYAMALWVWDALPAFASLDTVIGLPPGYARMLRYALAIELAPEFQRTPSPAIVAMAADAKAAIKRVNLITPTMACDDALTGGGGSGTNMAGFLSGS